MKNLRLSLMAVVIFWTAGFWPDSGIPSPASLSPAYATVRAQADDITPPAQPVKLIFIHHSTGQNWLDDGNGGLAIALKNNNYFVSDTNYGWTVNGDVIGDRTDIGNWYEWFGSGRSDTVLKALYTEAGQTFDFTRLGTDPGGENEITLFKSCFPNSALQGSPGDIVPPIGSNLLAGQGAGSDAHTVANAKGIYLDLLPYFQSMPRKLFVVITAPPLSDSTWAVNARAFNEWLADPVNGWLKDYPLQNVAVFDFYNVLTTNGGNADTNDLGVDGGNHHRWWHGAVQHKSDTPNHNTEAYPSGDDHPSPAGNLKATAEFVPLLNMFYHRWQASLTPPAVSDLRFTNAVTSTGHVTLSLLWTPPAAALTGTVRYSNGVVYFAFKSQSAGGWSPLSNPVFWPPRLIYLPLALR
jgi:hypothetical protein